MTSPKSFSDMKTTKKLQRMSAKLDPLNIVREFVSKHKKRFKEDGFNLDLSYVGRDIIAMGFPCENYEQVFRNPMSEVKKFFEQRHKGKYKIYNLCIERWYEESKFNGDVCHDYRFYDHEAPEFYKIHEFCKDVKGFLDKNADNICVIHCKAGKGRTGVMISCFLMYSQRCENPEKALEYYAKYRTKDGKGVTIPSQKRYIGYYHRFLQNGCMSPHPNQKLILNKIVLTSFTKTTILNFYIENSKKKLICDFKKEKGEMEKVHTNYHKHTIDCLVLLEGDNNIVFEKKSVKKGASIGGAKFVFMFKFWFNVEFIDNGYLCLKKRVLDTKSPKGHKSKSKRYPKNFKVELYFVHPVSMRRKDLLGRNLNSIFDRRKSDTPSTPVEDGPDSPSGKKVEISFI